VQHYVYKYAVIKKKVTPRNPAKADDEKLFFDTVLKFLNAETKENE